ncbi:MAG: hypothetical protein CL610_00675 [Anaerolineaceae bacterium]|nr:hypothetical protein [Anaerolineaceae bacterium]
MISRAQQLFRRKFVQDTIILQISKIGVTVLGLAAWVIVPVRLGPHHYGLFALAQSFLSIWMTFDLTGLNVGIPVLLSTAIGAKDERKIVDLLAVYLKVSTIWALFTLIMLALIGPSLANLLYQESAPLTASYGLSYPLLAGLQTIGNAQIGVFAAVLALSQLFDPIYNMFQSAFLSRRSMTQVAMMQNINQFVLTISLVSAALISPTAEGQVMGRLVYSVVTLAVIAVVYQRTRVYQSVRYPSLRAIFSRALTISYRPYWRYGLSTAVDKNISNLYVHVPLQMVGILAGPAAASYIQLGLRGIQRTGFFTSAIYENMQAVVPQSVGRNDYARLWHNFLRVLGVLTVAGLAFYGLLILLAPLLLVPIFGEEWAPILPILPAFTIYGLTITIGGIFGPLYRAFNLMREALLAKTAAFAVMLPAGLWLIPQLGTLGGVWMINGLLVISVGLTMVFTLPVLRQYALKENAAGTTAPETSATS